MYINEEQYKASYDDSNGTEVVTSFVTTAAIYVSSNRDSQEDRDALGHLEYAPSTGKVSCSHFFKDKHFKGVLTSSSKYSKYPHKIRFPLVPCTNVKANTDMLKVSPAAWQRYCRKI